MPWVRHAKVIALFQLEAGERCKVPGQSLGGGPGGGVHRSSENPGVSNCKIRLRS